VGDRAWSDEDNDNPDDMVEFTRNVLGEPDTILFIIERNLNRNVCYYQLDTDTKQVTPAWLMIPHGLDLSNLSIDEVDNQVTEEGLTMLETRAYGVDTIDDDHFTMRALKGEVFTIHRDGDTARATIVIDHKTWVVRRIMIHSNPNMLGIPIVKEVHLEVEDGPHRVTQFFFAV
jgi:hypothetical protein